LIFEQLIRDEIATERQLGRVACPVGIPIESTTVPEIAISIVAQLIERRAKLGQARQATELQTQHRHEPAAVAGCR
jgi:xanthine dehydrogenase accessory factor